MSDDFEVQLYFSEPKKTIAGKGKAKLAKSESYFTPDSDKLKVIKDSLNSFVNTFQIEPKETEKFALDSLELNFSFKIDVESSSIVKIFINPKLEGGISATLKWSRKKIN
jgi:hypothetical protein